MVRYLVIVSLQGLPFESWHRPQNGGVVIPSLTPIDDGQRSVNKSIPSKELIAQSATFPSKIWDFFEKQGVLAGPVSYSAVGGRSVSVTAA
jgi:hypothetical protein